MDIQMTREDLSDVVIKTCPYCFREISNAEAAFLIRPSALRFRSPALNELIAAGEDREYKAFWSSMGMPDEQIRAGRKVIDNEAIAALNRELSAVGRELAVKIYDKSSEGYSFQVSEGAVNLYSNTMVCPFCHNVLPQNFFRYEMLKIGLAGSVASGKTVFLSALIMNGYGVLQRENLTVRNASGNPADSYKLEMERDADRMFQLGICPRSTGKAFRKPVFIELNYHTGDRQIVMLAAVYDVAGELIREAWGSGTTGFVRHMDGFICMVDPAQMYLSRSVITKEIPDEGKVLGRLRLMSQAEQIAIQTRSNQNGKQVMDQSEYMTGEASGEKLITERKADIVLEAIRSCLGDASLSEKYMALTIAKSDLLEDLGEIREFTGSELLFERDQIRYGFMDTDHHFLRQSVLRPIFDQKIFRLQRYLDDYRESSLFAVSALGCETTIKIEGREQQIHTVSKVRPIRVEEPFLWMVMKFMQERGWLG